MTFKHYLAMLIIAFVLFVIAIIILFPPENESMKALGSGAYENLVEQTNSYLPSLDCINHDREQCIMV